MSAQHPYRAGDAVTWSRVASGGYGFVENVPATVVRTTDKRVVIDAALLSGGCKRVTVHWRNIAPRKAIAK